MSGRTTCMEGAGDLRRAFSRGLYVVLTEPRDGYAQLAAWAVEAEAPFVQLRYKGDDDRRFLEEALRIREITAGSRTRFIVNDRLDIALISDADGVHVGQEDVPPTRVRDLIGPDRLLGLSTHTLEQVRAARTEPVDYIGFGPLFATNSKARPDPVTGPDALARAWEISAHPIVAIGGLTAERIQRLSAAHCHNVAVIRAVTEAASPRAAMHEINALFRRMPC